MNSEEDLQSLDIEAVKTKVHVLHTITPFSKYFAIVLFIVLPFVGGLIGYSHSPEKIVEVTKVVVQKELPEETEEIQIDLGNKVKIGDNYVFTVPDNWDKSVGHNDYVGVRTTSPRYVTESYESNTDKIGLAHYSTMYMSYGRSKLEYVLGPIVYNQSFFLKDYINLLTIVDNSVGIEDEKNFSRWGDYGRKEFDVALKQDAINALKWDLYSATEFETTNKRFKGVSRFNSLSQDGFVVRYELMLVDTFFGDVINLSVLLDGIEFDPINLKEKLEKISHSSMQSEFISMFESAGGRDNLSFGFLMDDLDSMANSLEGINDRYVPEVEEDDL